MMHIVRAVAQHHLKIHTNERTSLLNQISFQYLKFHLLICCKESQMGQHWLLHSGAQDENFCIHVLIPVLAKLCRGRKLLARLNVKTILYNIENEKAVPTFNISHVKAIQASIGCFIVVSRIRTFAFMSWYLS